MHEPALGPHPTPQNEDEPDNTGVSLRLPHQRKQRQRRRLVRALLLVAVVSGPLLIGGGPRWAQLLSVALILIAATVCVVTRAYSIRLPVFFGVVVAGVLATLVQLLPLPASLVKKVSPQAFAVRAAAESNHAQVLPLTLDVSATLTELAKGLAYLVLFVMAVAVSRKPRGARTLLLGLIYMGGVCAALALLHRLVGAQLMFGFYRPRGHPGAGFFAPFVNGNQAAALMTISSLVGLGFAVQLVGALRWLCIGSVALACVVLPTTGARSAFLTLTVAAIVLLVRLLMRRFGGSKAVGLSAFLVLAVATLTLFGTDVLRSRFEGGVNAQLHNQKTRGWRDAVVMIGDFPWTGVGRGAFEWPFARYRHAMEGVRLAFPEALPLQLASEWGVPFSCVIACLALISFFRLGRSLWALEPPACAAAIAVVAVFTQELASFSLELTGIAIPTIVALAVVVGRCQRSPVNLGRKRLAPHITGPALGLAVLSFVCAVWAYPRSAEAEGDKLRRLVSSGHQATAEIAAAMARHPADAYLALLAHLNAVTHNPSQAQAALDHALWLSPADGTLNRISARWLARQNRRAQAALAYRLAAERGVPTQLEELLAALGPSLLSEAVPQTQAELLGVARLLLARKHLEQANIASGRSVELAVDREDAGMQRVALALQSGASSFMSEAADDLIFTAESAHAFGVAADAYAKAGAPELADAAVAKGLTRHPLSGALVLQGAQLRVLRGDVASALAFLKTQPVESLALAEQIELAKLKAQLLEAQGDRAGAVTARARARLMSDGLAQPAP